MLWYVLWSDLPFQIEVLGSQELRLLAAEGSQTFPALVLAFHGRELPYPWSTSHFQATCRQRWVDGINLNGQLSSKADVSTVLHGCSVSLGAQSCFPYSLPQWIRWLLLHQCPVHEYPPQSLPTELNPRHTCKEETHCLKSIQQLDPTLSLRFTQHKIKFSNA